MRCSFMDKEKIPEVDDGGAEVSLVREGDFLFGEFRVVRRGLGENEWVVESRTTREKAVFLVLESDFVGMWRSSPRSSRWWCRGGS